MKRRDFSKAALGLAAFGAVGTGALLSASETRQRTNQGRLYKAIKTNDGITPEKLAEVKALGFDGIEGSSPGIGDVAAYRAKAEAAGLPIHGVVCQGHWQERLSSPDPSVRDKGRQNLEQAIRDARALGGSSVLLVPGKVTGDDETHDDVWHRSIEEIRKALPVASYEGIHILVETVWNGFCEQPQQMADYIDEISSPWVKVYLDFGNMQKFAPAEEWVRTLGSRVVKLDVKDWGVKPGFCPLGEGDVNWAALREALAEIGFTGWVTREGSDGGLENTAKLMDELLDL
ncbi:MAG: sugar phosphate isomerase/epimerase [Verrucomicrobiae bacterium]|nr:sugar phosphate isomerase/epimerase [Verrucomicrobiae bacterium]